MVTNRKTVSSILVALATLIVMAAPAVALDFNGSISTGIADKDLFRGADVLQDSDVVVTPGLSVEIEGAGPGVVGIDYVSVRDENGKSTRTEAGLGYTLAVGNGILKDVTVGTTFYIAEDGNNTKEAYLALAFESALNPVFTAYLDYDEADGDGIYYTLEASHTCEAAPNMDVTVAALVSYNNESDALVGDYSDFNNAELSLSADWKVAEKLTITPSVTYSMPLSDDAEDIGMVDDDTTFGVALNLNF